MQMCSWPQVTCLTALVLWEELQVYNQKPCLLLRSQGSPQMLRSSASDKREAKREGPYSEPGTQRTPHSRYYGRNGEGLGTIAIRVRRSENTTYSGKTTCCCCFRKTKVQK